PTPTATSTLSLHDRSSDLDAVRDDAAERVRRGVVDAFGEQAGKHRGERRIGVALPASGERKGDVATTTLQIGGSLRDDLEDALRSEEHTSELQSRFDLVCR